MILSNYTNETLCINDIPTRVSAQTRSATGAGPLAGPLPKNDFNLSILDLFGYRVFELNIFINLDHGNNDTDSSQPNEKEVDYRSKR